MTNDLQAVTFFGNRMIVTGANGAIAYSDDGVNFTNASVSTANWLVSVAASSNRAVAVGDNAAIYQSVNGATWSLESGQPPYASPSWLTSVAYGNGAFVVVGDNGGISGNSYIATSNDGLTWTSLNIPTATLLSSMGNLEHVAWVQGSGSYTNFPNMGFWAVDDAGNTICSTNNGLNWAKITMASSTNVLYTVASDNATVLVAGDTEVRLGQVITNHLVWPGQTGSGVLTVPSWTYFASVLNSNGSYVLAGYDGQLVQSYPTNGSYAWNTPYYSRRDWLWQVVATSELYVAVGDNARIMTSANGADWTTETVPFTNSVSSTNTVFFGVGGTSNLLVAAGSGGSLAISPNVLVPVLETNTDGSLFTNNASSFGLTWYSLPAPANTTNDLSAVGVFSNKFYLTGANGTLMNSADGTNWNKLTSGTTNYLSGFTTVTNGLCVVSGNLGTILTSTNGTNWISRSSGTANWLYRLNTLKGRVVAVGENGTILTSTNAVNWVKQTSGVTNWLTDATMVSNTCYVVGNQGVVLASTNFINWTNIGTITTKSLESVATMNGQLVAVGFEGTILRSQIVPVTTPVNITQYTQSSGYNFFSTAGAVDQQFTLDSSSNLVSWVTGPLLNLTYGDGTLIFYQSVATNAGPKQFYRCTLAQ